MITIRTIALLSLTTGLMACAGMGEDEDVALSDVPAAAIAAAEGAVDGLQVKSAESEVKNGRTVYELKGKVNDVKHEVKVSADGEVLKVKTDD